MQETETIVRESTARDGNRARAKSGTARIVVLAGVIAIAALGLVALIRFFLAGTESTDDAAVDGNQVVLSAQTVDQITRLFVAEGDRVAKGEIVALLDDTTLKAQENQSEVNVGYATENVALAQVKLDQAQGDLRRATVQLENKIIPKEQYDHLRQAYQAALAGRAIALSQEKLAAAQLATVETDLAHTRIASPLDGVVAKKWAVAGDVVQPAQPIYTVYDLANLWVEANFKETQLGGIAIGDPAKITLDAFPGRVFSGKVESIGAATASEFSLIPPDNASGNFTKVTQRVPVRFSIDADSKPADPRAFRLLPGMSADVTVRTEKE